MQSFAAMWDLHVCGCDERCWADKKNMTVHRLRLEIAEHMDIPLHEVQELDISFMTGSRPGEASVARMHIRITSPRHSLETGTSMLRSLFYNMERSSEVLAMLVLGSREISTQQLGFLHKRIKQNTEDVYLPYYQELDLVKKSSAHSKTKKVVSTVESDDTEFSTKPWMASQIGLGCMVSAGLMALILKHALSKHTKAREPTLRSLGEPLASPEDPPLFPGSHVTRLVMPFEKPCDISHHAAVDQYLVTVYARALR
jgi:hypothetical protein